MFRIFAVNDFIMDCILVKLWLETMGPNNDVNWSRFYKSFQAHKSLKLIFGTRDAIDQKYEECLWDW